MFLQLPKDLENCDAIKDDVNALTNWSKQFYSPLTLGPVIMKRLTTGWITASTLSVDAISYFTNGDYYQTGRAVGELAIIACGPVKTNSSDQKVPETLFLY